MLTGFWSPTSWFGRDFHEYFVRINKFNLVYIFLFLYTTSVSIRAKFLVQNASKKKQIISPQCSWIRTRATTYGMHGGDDGPNDGSTDWSDGRTDESKDKDLTLLPLWKMMTLGISSVIVRIRILTTIWWGGQDMIMELAIGIWSPKWELISQNLMRSVWIQKISSISWLQLRRYLNSKKFLKQESIIDRHQVTWKGIYIVETIKTDTS